MPPRAKISQRQVVGYAEKPSTNDALRRAGLEVFEKFEKCILQDLLAALGRQPQRQQVPKEWLAQRVEQSQRLFFDRRTAAVAAMAGRLRKAQLEDDFGVTRQGPRHEDDARPCGTEELG